MGSSSTAAAPIFVGNSTLEIEECPSCASGRTLRMNADTGHLLAVTVEASTSTCAVVVLGETLVSTLRENGV